MRSSCSTRVHQPPSASAVRALTRAGLSWSTAVAMEGWKAQEVLELLGYDQQERSMDPSQGADRGRGTL